jgi:hypothetical protein
MIKTNLDIASLKLMIEEKSFFKLVKMELAERSFFEADEDYNSKAEVGSMKMVL